MAGAVYRAEFIVNEVPLADNPHKELSSTIKGANPTAVAGAGQSLGAVAKKMLPKLGVALVASTAIKTGQFIYNTVNTNQANSAMLAGDTIAYKHLQNQSTVVNNWISIGSAVAMGAITGAIIGTPIPIPGARAIGAGVGALIAAASQGIQQALKIPEHEEQKRVYREQGNIERMVNSLDRERFGTNARTFR